MGPGPEQKGCPHAMRPARTPASAATHPSRGSFSRPSFGSWTILPGPRAIPKACVPLFPLERSQGQAGVLSCPDRPTLPSEQGAWGARSLHGSHVASTSTPVPRRSRHARQARHVPEFRGREVNGPQDKQMSVNLRKWKTSNPFSGRGSKRRTEQSQGGFRPARRLRAAGLSIRGGSQRMCRPAGRA